MGLTKALPLPDSSGTPSAAATLSRGRPGLSLHVRVVAQRAVEQAAGVWCVGVLGEARVGI
jgi:hypothetical protein